VENKGTVKSLTKSFRQNFKRHKEKCCKDGFKEDTSGAEKWKMPRNLRRLSVKIVELLEAKKA